MGQDIWKAGSDVEKVKKDLIAQYHPDLAIIEEEIVIIFKEKSSIASGKVIAGKTKKAPPILGVLTDKKFEYRFIIELGADTWATLDDKQRVALIDHHLCSMECVEDADSGEIKCSVKPPDFSGYKEEFERHGMWRPLDDDTINAVENMFKDDNSKTPKKRVSDVDISTMTN